MGVTVSSGQTIKGNITKLYDFPSYEKQTKKRILEGTQLRTLFKEFQKATPIGESILIATFLRWAQEVGRPYRAKDLLRTLKLCEEKFDYETRAWLAQRVLEGKLSGSWHKSTNKNAARPDNALTKKADNLTSEPKKEGGVSA